ncbi:MAG: MMPL family transporter [Rhodothermales bacterium]|nr:MMPL family transporter [Rhodothermales bacterium]
MHRFFEALRPLIRFTVQHPLWILAIAGLFTVLGLYNARLLRVDTDFANLLPHDYPSVQALERLRDTVGSESGVDVAIVSPSFEANRQFAEQFIPRALALRDEEGGEPDFSRVDYRHETDFLKDNALYFATDAELDQLESFIDDKIEESRLAANPFFFDLEDEEEEPEPDSTAQAMEKVYDDLVGNDYPISDDSTTLVLRFIPTGSATNIRFIERVYADLDGVIAELDPSRFHPDMEVVTAGRLLRQYTEISAITNDVRRSFGAGVFTVLFVVVLYFLYKGYRAQKHGGFSWSILLRQAARIPVLALLIAIPLLMSLSWTFGIAYVAFETLNLMTSTLGLVLFGLGIDFGIHFYARYTEERGKGKSMPHAAEDTFASTGQAITVGALTTAAAMYALTLADFRGFSEFGFIAGTGIILALLAMLLVMPALISVFERTGLLHFGAVEAATISTRYAPFPAVKTILAVSVSAVVLALLFLPRVAFEYDFGTLEPTYEAYNARRDYINRVYNDGERRNPAYIVVDRPEEVLPLVQTIRESAAADTISPTVREVESLQERFPTLPAGQQRKLSRIEAMRERLEDPFLSADSSEGITRLRRSAQTSAPIDLSVVPGYLKDRFTSRNGEIGNFIIIYPSVGLSDGRQSIAFSDDIGRVETSDGKEYYASSSSLVAADMLRLMRSEAPWMVLATFVIVLCLMYVNFRSIRWAALATVPLLVGVLWMLLAMEFFGLKLNFYNLIVLPAVLGIGNDAGVHIVHRYREEGRRSIMHVLRSTGEHVSMASLTTMIGFSGLLLSFHPGLHSIGQLAVVGIGATLLSSMIFLPALLQWMENRQPAA